MGATNVTRFADGAISASGNAGSITVGSVSVGDLVVFAANVLTGGVVAEPASVSDSLGNTITPRLQVTDTTFGPYDVYEIIVTNAGTMTLTATGASGTTTVGIWGSQWTGTASWSYDSNGSVNNAYGAGGGNGQDQQTSDITFGAQSVAFAFFGGVGIGANSPLSTDAGWNTASKGSGAFGGDLVADQAMSGGTGHFHAQYASFVYSGGAILSYSYTLGGGFDPQLFPRGQFDYQPPVQRRTPPSFGIPPFPADRNAVSVPATYPAHVTRPSMHASRQQAVALTPTDRNAPLLPNVAPDAVRRPAMAAAEQQSLAAPPLPPDARAVPWNASTAPDTVRRPAMLAAEQMAASPRELLAERPYPYADGIEPDMVRRALEHASQQRPFADPTYGWALAVAAPNITPPSWPDTVRRPSMPASEQRADAPLVPLDRPFPQVDGYAPPAVNRPRMLTAEQQALAAPPAPPDARTVPWSDATMPAAVRRPAMIAALQQAFVDETYAQLLVVVPNVTPPVFPEAVRQPYFAASQQRAFTTTTTTDAPYPQFFPAVVPERVYRPSFLAALQQALALQPRPERADAIASVYSPDRVERPAVRAALQQAHAEPQYTDRGVPWWGVTVPERVYRALMPTSEQQAHAGLGAPITPTPAPDLVAACYPASVSSVFFHMAAIAPATSWTPWWALTSGLRAYAKTGDRRFPDSSASSRYFPYSSASDRLGKKGRTGNE